VETFAFTVDLPWGRASDPAGVAPEPSREFLTPSGVILTNSQKRCRHQWWKVLIGFALRGGFDVLSIERASSPQIEFLAGSPSENLCPF
jgi:hypothetical protein